MNWRLIRLDRVSVHILSISRRRYVLWFVSQNPENVLCRMTLHSEGRKQRWWIGGGGVDFEGTVETGERELKLYWFCSLLPSGIASWRVLETPPQSIFQDKVNISKLTFLGRWSKMTWYTSIWKFDNLTLLVKHGINWCLIVSKQLERHQLIVFLFICLLKLM